MGFTYVEASGTTWRQITYTLSPHSELVLILKISKGLKNKGTLKPSTVLNTGYLDSEPSVFTNTSLLNKVYEVWNFCQF